jgi:two-component system response regulator NreC
MRCTPRPFVVAPRPFVVERPSHLVRTRYVELRWGVGGHLRRLIWWGFEYRVSEQPVGVMLVDNNTVVRESLGALIGQHSDLVVIAQAASVTEAGTLDVTPDVIVADVELPDARLGEVVSGLHAVFAKSAIFVLTTVDQPVKIQAVLAAGADGYLLKSATTDDLLTGIRVLAQGGSYLQSSLGIALARWLQPRDADLALSPKEEQTLRLIALGHTNAEVARALNVSLRTIESHRARIHLKLGRLTRAELVQHARETGLVE